MKLKLAESDQELIEILKLQNINHLDNLTKDQKQSDGFVTVKHDFDSLKKMNDNAQHVIAVDNEEVVGYALVMLKEFRNLIPTLVPLFDTFEEIEYQGMKLGDHNYYAMGQVCVADSYRGKGVFKALYEKHKDIYSSTFDLCLTEVSSSNPRSMKAHLKVGFKTIHTFSDTSDEWNILSWDWS
jgi:ribosomal protein S18 acetylase RimI-like enzyme